MISKVNKTVVVVLVFLVFVLTLGACAQRSAAPAPVQPGSEPPAQIKVFMQKITVDDWYPDNFDPINNWCTEVLEELANVKIVDWIMPMYYETADKFNLMMASGDIPDFIQVGWQGGAMRQFGDEGAFIDLTDRIANSQVMNKYYNDVQIKQMRSTKDDSIYVIFSLPVNDDFNLLFVREDLLHAIGVTELPETLEAQVEAMRALKKYDPSSIIMTSTGGINWATTIAVIDPFNTAVSGWRYYPERGKVCNNWEGDNIIKCLEYVIMLYTDGLLDKEFITNSADDVGRKRLKDNLLIWGNNRGTGPYFIEIFANDGNEGARVMPIMVPMADGVGVDAYLKQPAILGGYSFAISAKTKEADACWRLMEALYSETVQEMFVYGREGIEFEVVNGAKIPIFPAAADTAWRGTYGWAFTCATGDSLASELNVTIFNLDYLTQEEKIDYSTRFNAQMKKIADSHLYKLDYNPATFLPPMPDALVNKQSEANTEMTSIFLKTVVGEMTLDQFKVERERILNDNKDVSEWYDAEIEKIKAERDLTFRR